MSRTVLALALVAACGGGAREASPTPAASQDDHSWEGHLDEPEPRPVAPAREPVSVDLPPADIGDDLVAPAGASADATARFDAAVRAYDLGDFQAAIDELKHAYEFELHDEYLFDLAQAYRMLGYAKEALFFYKRYAAMTRDAPKVDVTRVIEDLQEVVDAMQP